MRVQLPVGLVDEVMRSAAAVPQARRTWISAFGPFTPAIAAVAATAAVIIAVGLVLVAPRTVGPPPEPTATPAPTLTPESALALTAPGDVVRIPAMDSQGQFGVITLERGEERASYPDYIPIAAIQAGEVFFVEVRVTYQLDRETSDAYGNIDFGFAVDADGDGLDGDDVIQQHLGYSLEGVELETGPQPLLPFVNLGAQEMTGWIAFELPAAGAEYDVYLVQLAEVPDRPAASAFTAVASALLREPAEPVGVTSFDIDDLGAFPEPSGELPDFQELPTPLPSPAATFEPVADADADALFTETQACAHSTGATVTFPAAWHTNEAYEDLPACTWFAPEPMDTELIYEGLSNDGPPVLIVESDGWMGGANQPDIPRANITRVPIGDRVAWLVTYDEYPSHTYLIPLTDDAYGSFLRPMTGQAEFVAVLQRIVALLELPE